MLALRARLFPAIYVFFLWLISGIYIFPNVCFFVVDQWNLYFSKCVFLLRVCCLSNAYSCQSNFVCCFYAKSYVSICDVNDEEYRDNIAT